MINNNSSERQNVMLNKNKSSYKMIIIDDNRNIHEDFIKILAPKEKTTLLNKLEENLFGNIDNNISLAPAYEIDSAMQGEDGFMMIKNAYEAGNPYALAFVDIRMPPGWNGIETIKKIRDVDKDIQIVICTAFSDFSWEETISRLGRSDNLLILKKPFDQIEVRQIADALTTKWHLLKILCKKTEILEENIKEHTTSLKQSLSLIRATLEASSDGIVALSNERNITTYNTKFLEMWDIPRNEINKYHGDILENYIKSKLENPSAFRPAIMTNNTNKDMPTEILTLTNGNIYELSSQPQIISNEVVGIVMTFHDITKSTQLKSQLSYQLTHDQLTNLPNRIYILNKMRDEIEDKRNQNTQVKFAVMYLDVDRFKLINDSFSQTFGDKLLREIANRLTNKTENNYIPARISADEFALVITNFNNHHGLDVFIKKILHKLTRPYNINNREISITFSAGISIYPDDGTNVDTLMRNADTAMHHAKNQGSNNYQHYTNSMAVQSILKLQKEIELRKAIEENQFSLCFQPQIDIKSNTLIAVEALIRWNHPTEGVILPDDFIPLAEECGLIVQIGEWTLRAACEQCHNWKKEGYPPIRMAINISTHQLQQANFVSYIATLIKEFDINPALLELEITENTIISSMESIKVVDDLKKLGLELTLDDFGTGNSSISYLKTLPIDRIKIDKSFINNINLNTSDEAIIHAIVSMAKSLNLDILAEGVENEKQLSFLKNNQVKTIQGYYFSNPLSSDELKQLIQDNQYIIK